MVKGQYAMEYLVTYGWAIAAIVIIATVLYFSGSPFLYATNYSTSYLCIASSGYGISEYSMKGNDHIYKNVTLSGGQAISEITEEKKTVIINGVPIEITENCQLLKVEQIK